MIFTEVIQSQKNIFNTAQTNEKIVYLFLFLFPVAGPVIRHWNSSFFSFIFFCSLFFLFSKAEKKPILKEEKILLFSFALFFLSYVISMLMNWHENQSSIFGLEIRFLAFVPMYLLIREYEYSLKVFFAGILLSIPVIFAFSVIEYFFIPTVTPGVISGVYSTLFIGPITALFLLFYPAAYKEWFTNKKYPVLFVIAYLMGLFVVIFAYARTGYITLIIGGLILIIFSLKKLKHKVLSFGIIFVITFGIFNVEHVKKRVMTGVSNVNNYLKAPNNANSNSSITSLGLRLEMWRSSQYVIKEHPFFGVGAGNFSSFIDGYVEDGKVHGSVKNRAHLHNSFIEVVVNKGLFGLILLLMLFYYPLYLAWKYRERCKHCYLYMITLSAALTLMSIGESMLINKNNGTSHFILFTIILFSYLMRKVHSANFKKHNS